METSQSDVTEEQQLANLFFDLYKGLDRAFGCYNLSNAKTEVGKEKGRARTELGDYTAKLWTQHLAGTQGLGVVPIQDDGTCWWGAIDIDVYDLDLVQLEQKVRKLNLPLLVLRTKSGGAHLAIFFNEPIKCKLVRGKLYEFAIALGYGGVEIFPKQSMLASKKDVGNWLNMPYFDHKLTTRHCIFKGKPIKALQFIELANKVKISEAQLKELEVSVEGGDFDDGPPCLQLISRSGAPEGTRNNTMFAVAVYCRNRWEDDWQNKVEDYNAKIMSPPLKSKEIQTIIRSAGRKEYYYPCTKAPLISNCNRELCRKRLYGIGQGEEEFNLNLGSLLKIETDPPMWIIDVEGVRVQLDTEDLMMQDRFRRACMMAVNRLPPAIKRNDWEKILREKLETVEMIEAPVESRVSSRISQYAHQFLMNTPPARVREELMVGRPWLDKETNMIQFRGNDLLRFLENQGLRHEPRRIWSSLRDNGTTHQQIKIRGNTLQVWCLPKSLVPDIELDVPQDFKEAF